MTSLLDLVRERKAALEREQRAFLGDLEGRHASGTGSLFCLSASGLSRAVHTKRFERACVLLGEGP
jgi:hypothetical protein